MAKEVKTKLRFRDLSWPLKLVIILGWIYGLLFVVNAISMIFSSFAG
jgi:uncharacterized integral membrane protein